MAAKNKKVSAVCPLRLGVSVGIIWGLVVFIYTILALSSGFAKAFLMVLMSVYPGYSITGTGAIVGFFYGFVDGFIVLFLIGWLYNKLAK